MIGACGQATNKLEENGATSLKLEANNKISGFLVLKCRTLVCVYLPTEDLLSHRQAHGIFSPLLISVVFPANGSGALSCPYQRAPAPRLNHCCQEIRPVERDTVSPSRRVQGLLISAGDQGECNLFDGFVFPLSFFWVSRNGPW